MIRQLDLELLTLLKAEKAAIDVEKIAELMDSDRLLKAAANTYVAVGGSLSNLSRIIQIIVDGRVVNFLENTDFPGPFDDYLKPKIREWIVTFIAAKFNELTSNVP